MSELDKTEPMIRRLAEKAWEAFCKEPRVARTVVLKLKTSTFQVITRSFTPETPLASCEEITRFALALRERVVINGSMRFGLAGVGLSNFCEQDHKSLQATLFPAAD